MHHKMTSVKRALDILGLPPLVTREDIRKQYHFLARRHHPDQGGDAEKMEEISEAYTLLMHYIKEFRYTFDDEEISRQIPGADHAKRFKF
jgi:DnaJ-class molecular chaperone